MDYHVFILSRIRESYDRTRETDQAVAHGIKISAGVVTAPEAAGPGRVAGILGPGLEDAQTGPASGPRPGPSALLDSQGPR